MPRTASCFVTATLMFLVAIPVEACPFCQTATAEKIRNGIFNSDFVYHFMAMAAPFPILGLALVLIYFPPVGKRPTINDAARHEDTHFNASSEDRKWRGNAAEDL